MSQAVESDIEVLEFALGDETYCVNIEYVEEIVDMGELTTVPNSASHVEGVMDLRGRTTTIVDPKVILGIGEEGDKQRIVIFDPEALDQGGAMGWIVDDADRVVRIADEDVEESTVSEDETVQGVIKQDDEFVIYVDPTEVDT